MSGVPTVFIDGAAGTTGLEIRDRLSHRADLGLETLTDDLRRDPKARSDALNAADLVILCLPDQAAREAVALIRSPRVRVIDASSAHRTAPGWTYGLPELAPDQRGAIRTARRVANPGCYPTGFLLLVRPLVDAGLIAPDRVLGVHAVSGYSGGGTALIQRFDGDRELGWRGYSYGADHKHLAEMRRHSGLDEPPIFSPAVVRALRGMMVEVPVADLDAGAARAALEARYAGEPLVAVEPVGDELLLAEGTDGTDRVSLHVVPASARHARLIARFDNLGKGAAGAAVQNLNLMVGADEAAGLRPRPAAAAPLSPARPPASS